MKKNILFNVIRQNETVDGFLDLTGYISEADKVMEYMDYQKERISREVIPLEELEKAAPQATGLIMTEMHPWEFLNSANARGYIKGFVTKNYGLENKRLKVDVRVIDNETIKDIKVGKKEQFSIGYYCDILEEPGTTETGEYYDIKQVDLKLNHFSLVPTGRAGEKVGVITLNAADDNISYQKGMFIKENSNKNTGGDNNMAIKYNGKEMEAHELHSELVLRDTQLKEVTNAKENLEGKLAAKETELNEASTKLNGIDEKLNSEVIAKVNAISEVSKLTGEKPEDLMKLNTIELKKKVINKAFEGMNLEGKTEAYLDGLFEGATVKLNSSLPETTEGTVKENSVEKKNGQAQLAEALKTIGGKK